MPTPSTSSRWAFVTSVRFNAYPESVLFYLSAYPDSVLFYLSAYPDTVLFYLNADPDSVLFYLNAYPDSVLFYLNADPDSGSQTNADTNPDTGLTFKSLKVEFLLEKYT